MLALNAARLRRSRSSGGKRLGLFGRDFSAISAGLGSDPFLDLREMLAVFVS